MFPRHTRSQIILSLLPFAVVLGPTPCDGGPGDAHRTKSGMAAEARTDAQMYENAPAAERETAPAVAEGPLDTRLSRRVRKGARQRGRLKPVGSRPPVPAETGLPKTKGAPAVTEPTRRRRSKLRARPRTAQPFFPPGNPDPELALPQAAERGDPAAGLVLDFLADLAHR